MKGFEETLKSEMFYGIKRNDKAKPCEVINKYINFYNNERFQANLKGITTNQFRNHANLNLLPLVI